MANKTYYWIDRTSNFGAGKNRVSYGEEIPSSIDPKQLEAFIANGWASTEKTITERQLSELEQLRKEVLELKEGGSGADPKAVQTALDTSVQSDLDRIAELEGDETLELIEGVINEIKPALSKEDILAKVKEIKDLIKGE